MIGVILLAAVCRNPALGAEVTNISHRIRKDREIPDYVTGAIVRLVRIRSSAARAGIQVGDVIQGVGDQLIQNVCGFESAVAKHGCGDVQLTIRRTNATIALDAKIVDSPPVTRKISDQAACQNGDPPACTALGKAHRAIDLFRLACDLGDSEGCYLLGVNIGSENKDAAPPYEQACDGGNALACTNLGWMYQFGHGVRADAGEAVRLYRRGCEGSRCTGPNNVGCVNLGRMLLEGTGAPADPFQATRIFREVCDRGSKGDDYAEDVARACSLAGTAFLIGKGAVKDIQQALTLLEKGCAAGDPFGCYNLGTIYDNGDDVKQDRARAVTYYQRACAAGDAEACQRIATLQRP